MGNRKQGKKVKDLLICLVLEHPIHKLVVLVENTENVFKCNQFVNTYLRKKFTVSIQT